MSLLNLDKWAKDPNLEGLLFFAQSVYDMLFDYTLDSYKVPTLNTHMRCLEAIDFTYLVDRRLIHQNSLEPIIDEFLYSFKNDYLVGKIFGGKRITIENEVDNNRGKNEKLKDVLIHIATILDKSYIENARRELSLIIRDEPEKKDLIYNLARSLLPELIYRGYSKSSIFFKTKSYFFDGGYPTGINSPEQLDEYLNAFDFKEKEFDLIFKADNTFKYITGSSATPKPRTGKTEENTFFSEVSKEFPFLITFKKIRAFDADNARNIAEDNMRVYGSLLKYYIHKRDFSWHNKVLTYELPSNYPLVVDKPTKAVYKRPDKDFFEIRRDSKRILELYDGELDDESVEKIFGALKLHTEAVSANTKENQLLTFWSAIEGILSLPSDEGRITNILNSIEPLLVFDYPKKLIFDLLKNLGKHGDEERKIIESIGTGTNFFEKGAAIISIKASEPLRDEIYSLLQKHGDILLKHRLFELKRKLDSAENIAKTIEEHKKRIIWHVQRMYRTRNTIAHSMKRPTHFYFDTLIENLHAYVDRILELLIKTSIENPDIDTLERIILKIKIDTDAHLNILKENKKNACTADNYLLFLFGPQ